MKLFAVRGENYLRDMRVRDSWIDLEPFQIFDAFTGLHGLTQAWKFRYGQFVAFAQTSLISPSE